MKMTPEARLHIEVEVLADGGHWWPGVIEHVRERGGQREAWVRYSTGVGELRVGWFGLDECVVVDGTTDEATLLGLPSHGPTDDQGACGDVGVIPSGMTPTSPRL